MAISPPLVAHVIHRLGTGGMENGLVNIINRTPPERFHHAVVCLTDAGCFARRISSPDVKIVSLHRPPGHGFALYRRLWAVLRELRPDVVHTRNLAALEGQIPALFIFNARRVHGEHGRDAFDLHGANRKYNLLRRAIRPLVQRYIAVSKDLAQWLTKTVGVEPDRIRQIYNGVNPALFYPRQGARPDVAPPGFIPPNGKLIGTVGRLAVVKDQPTLVRAFAQVLRKRPQWRERLRLVMVGDGPLRPQVEACLHAEAMDSFVWLPGDREDVADLLRTLDLFVLPSLGEGISNTILEAMATGLPVIATRVGGNPELVDEGVTGALVPPADPAALADAVEAYVQDEAYMHQQGAAGHHKASRAFTWERCVEEYLGVYDELLGRSNA